MTQCFINTPAGPEPDGTPWPTPNPDRERLHVLIIGSRSGVLETIHNLHRRGFAAAGDWSPLLPGGQLGEVMSILTRDRQKES